MAASIKTVICPTCGAAVEWRPESVFRPFCSERCKLIDLGAWGNEDYCVSVEDGPAEDQAHEV